MIRYDTWWAWYFINVQRMRFLFLIAFLSDQCMMHHNHGMRSYRQYHAVISRVSFSIVMYFFRVFEIVNAGFCLRWKKILKWSLQKIQLSYLLYSLIWFLMVFLLLRNGYPLPFIKDIFLLSRIFLSSIQMRIKFHSYNKLPKIKLEIIIST